MYYQKTKKFFKSMAVVFALLFFVSISYAASVDVSANPSPINYDDGDDYHLSATTDGFDTCDFIDYSWEETSNTLFIDQSYTKDDAVIYANDIHDHPGTYTIKLTAICNGGNPDDGGFIEEDTFVLTINGGISEQSGDETVASVDAGPTQNVTIGDTVYLNGSINGFPDSGCKFQYNWFDDSERVTISNSGTLTEAYFETSNFTGTVNLKIGLEVIVSSSEITHDSCGKTGTYQDKVTININPKSTKKSHHRSHYSRMKQEANTLFLHPKNIKLHIYKGYRYSDVLYNLQWNYVGGENIIQYELEYNTKKDFSGTGKVVKTFMRSYDFVKYSMVDSDIYFFRVRATYLGKHSPWSNIVSITNKDSPLKYFKIKCKNCNNKISYQDVFKTPDLLIEKEFKITCSMCKNKNTFSDVFVYKTTNDLIDENLHKKSCTKKVNYGDIFDYKKGVDFKVDCKNCFKKIKFDNLLLK